MSIKELRAHLYKSVIFATDPSNFINYETRFIYLFILYCKLCLSRYNFELNMHLFAIFLLIIIVLLYNVHCYRFLGVLHTSVTSHFIVGSSLMKELARRGHDVTVISPFPLKKPLNNYHDIETPSIKGVMSGTLDNLLKTIETNVLKNMVDFHEMGLDVSRTFLREVSVQELMASNQTFDAVICEVFLSESLFGLSEHFKAPLIGLGTFGAHKWNTDMVGSPSPPSYVPSAAMPFNDHMTLTQRLGNFLYNIFERLLLDFYYLPKQAAIYKEFFPNNKRDMYDVRRNAALVLLNQHVSLNFPRPYVSNQIEVGGMHINRQSSPLPTELELFISESKYGVIYFSMGSNLRSATMPLEKRKAILETFRGLKQRVLWKFENPHLENKPDNVYISSWFPQDDILAHPNVIFFITHGGLLSTTESIYHGKPFIGIPIFGDQFLNMNRAETSGFGIRLDYMNLTRESFSGAIDRMLSDKSYAKRSAEASARYKDQPMKPLDLAVYWVEYVARHKGAKHLHCAGQDLDFIQYHSIDVLLILFVGLSVAFISIMLIIRIAWGWLQFAIARKDIKAKVQ